MSRDGILPVRPSLQKFFLLDDDLTQVPQPSNVVLPTQLESSQTLLLERSPPLQASPFLEQPIVPQIVKPVLPPFAENAENQYGRYVPNSLIVSHLLRRDDTGEVLQFAIPPTGVCEVPVVKPLIGEIVAYTLPDGNKTFHGKTDDGIDMVSCRSYQLKINEIDYTFIPLSPLKGKRLPSESSFVDRFKKTKEAKKIIERTEIYVKAGQIKVINTDIARRADTPRTPDQNAVMGMSAVDVYKKALKENEAVLTNDAKGIMETAANTLWRGSTIFEAQLRPEHLHLLGYGYYPMEVSDKNPHLVGELSTPQRVSNLGAARRCDNTRMMIQERTGERFIRRYPDAEVEVGGAFTMLLDTEVVNIIYYWIQIVRGDFKVKFTQKIDTFERDPQFAKASDMASLVEIFCMMVQNIGPLSVQKVIMSDKPAISQFPRNFYKLKKKTPQEESRKREREEVVVMQAPVVNQVTVESPVRQSITRTPFLFARRENTISTTSALVDQRAEAINAMKKAAQEAKNDKKEHKSAVGIAIKETLDLDEDAVLLLHQLLDAQPSEAARRHP